MSIPWELSVGILTPMGGMMLYILINVFLI